MQKLINELEQEFEKEFIDYKSAEPYFKEEDPERWANLYSWQKRFSDWLVEKYSNLKKEKNNNTIQKEFEEVSDDEPIEGLKLRGPRKKRINRAWYLTYYKESDIVNKPGATFIIPLPLVYEQFENINDAKKRKNELILDGVKRLRMTNVKPDKSYKRV